MCSFCNCSNNSIEGPNKDLGNTSVVDADDDADNVDADNVVDRVFFIIILGSNMTSSELIESDPDDVETESDIDVDVDDIDICVGIILGDIDDVDDDNVVVVVVVGNDDEDESNASVGFL